MTIANKKVGDYSSYSLWYTTFFHSLHRQKVLFILCCFLWR